MGSDSIPPKLSDESINQGLVYAHMHSITRADVHVLDGWMPPTKTLQACLRRNMTTSMVGIKMVTYAKISPKMVNPRDTAGETQEKKEKMISYPHKAIKYCHFMILFFLLFILIHIEYHINRSVYSVPPPSPLSWLSGHLVLQKLSHLILHASWSTKFFHSCYDHRHHGLQPFYTCFSGFDLGLGSPGQSCWVHFLTHFPGDQDEIGCSVETAQVKYRYTSWEQGFHCQSFLWKYLQIYWWQLKDKQNTKRATVNKQNKQTKLVVYSDIYKPVSFKPGKVICELYSKYILNYY